ncbi:DUF3311 domain-containing protein [Prauserella oleivorans]|uniref:DUF3311 domain-containing protein n=1 Tax=Prauserella oleivorans TaxID=1478153 RepID=A0ABW5WI22_9PSEU
MAAHAGKTGNGLRFNAWNLLLLVPLWILITPLYNREEPRLFGMPFFYWCQFAGIAVGVLCTALVYLKTRSRPVVPAPGAGPDVDDLDEGARR